MTGPMGGIGIVVPNDLAESGPTIMTVAMSIGVELDELKRFLLPLKEFWTGQAQGGWDFLQGAWDASAAALMDAPGTLGQLSQAANTNWLNYVDCEQANVRTWAH